MSSAAAGGATGAACHAGEGAEAAGTPAPASEAGVGRVTGVDTSSQDIGIRVPGRGAAGAVVARGGEDGAGGVAAAGGGVAGAAAGGSRPAGTGDGSSGGVQAGGLAAAGDATQAGLDAGAGPAAGITGSMGDGGAGGGSNDGGGAMTRVVSSGAIVAGADSDAAGGPASDVALGGVHPDNGVTAARPGTALGSVGAVHPRVAGPFVPPGAGLVAVIIAGDDAAWVDASSRSPVVADANEAGALAGAA